MCKPHHACTSAAQQSIPGGPISFAVLIRKELAKSMILGVRTVPSMVPTRGGDGEAARRRAHLGANATTLEQRATGHMMEKEAAVATSTDT